MYEKYLMLLQYHITIILNSDTNSNPFYMSNKTYIINFLNTLKMVAFLGIELFEKY